MNDKDLLKIIKSGNKTKEEINLLKTVLGEIQLEEARKNKTVSDSEVEKIIQKFVKNNKQTIEIIQDPIIIESLRAENKLLESLLPDYMTEKDLYDYITGLTYDRVVELNHIGRSTGYIVKKLKREKRDFQGADVNKVINAILEKHNKKIEVVKEVEILEEKEGEETCKFDKIGMMEISNLIKNMFYREVLSLINTNQLDKATDFCLKQFRQRNLNINPEDIKQVLKNLK